MPGGEATAWCWCGGVLINFLKCNVALGGKAGNEGVSLGPARAIPAAAPCPGASFVGTLQSKSLDGSARAVCGLARFLLSPHQSTCSLENPHACSLPELSHVSLLLGCSPSPPQSSSSCTAGLEPDFLKEDCQKSLRASLFPVWH